MDEQRVQAYVALIEKLFACPEGEEGAVLQQHSNLGVRHLRYAGDRLFYGSGRSHRFRLWCVGMFQKVGLWWMS